jgi:amino acid transporter
MSLAIIVPTALNLFSADIIGKAETYLVAIKITLLAFFAAVGVFGIQPQRLAVAAWSPPLHLLAGGMIIFVAYEGFELIANTAQDVRDYRRVLPRAYYASVGFVILLYILVSAVTVGGLPLAEIAKAKDYALAAAAKPFLGAAGFRLIAAAALLSTMSAINATLYGSARLAFTIAKEGELPAFLEKKVWNKHIEGLLITSVLALFLANSSGLSAISTLGSAGFLMVFAAVNAANWALHDQTGGRRWISGLGAAACLGALGALLWQSAGQDPGSLWILAALVGCALGVEGGYRLFRRGGLRLH